MRPRPLLLLLLLAACDRAEQLGPALTTPPTVEHVNADYAAFRPVAKWPWSGTTACLDLTGVPGEYDPESRYHISMVAPTREQFTSAVRLEFDANKRLILYQESRHYVWLPGRPRPNHTSTSLVTGITTRSWERIGSATNYRFKGAHLTQEHLKVTADEAWHHPRLGIPELYALAVARCAPGTGFTSTFERAAAR